MTAFFYINENKSYKATENTLTIELLEKGKAPKVTVYPSWIKYQNAVSRIKKIK